MGCQLFRRLLPTDADLVAAVKSALLTCLVFSFFLCSLYTFIEKSWKITGHPLWPDG